MFVLTFATLIHTVPNCTSCIDLHRFAHDKLMWSNLFWVLGKPWMDNCFFWRLGAIYDILIRWAVTYFSGWLAKDGAFFCPLGLFHITPAALLGMPPGAWVVAIKTTMRPPSAWALNRGVADWFVTDLTMTVSIGLASSFFVACNA